MNLKNLVVSAGLLALLGAPVFANEPTPAEGTDHPTATGDAHPAHPEKTAKVKKPAAPGKKHKKGHPGEGTEAPAPTGN